MIANSRVKSRHIQAMEWTASICGGMAGLCGFDGLFWLGVVTALLVCVAFAVLYRWLAAGPKPLQVRRLASRSLCCPWVGPSQVCAVGV